MLQSIQPLRETYQLRCLPTHTLLFHGTDCVGNFKRIQGPAWFTLDQESASKWAGWATPPKRRVRGPKRVVCYKTAIRLDLIDTSDESDWRRYCEELCNDPDAIITSVAKATRKLLLDGWYGDSEIMISRSETDLIYVKEFYI